MKKEPDRQDRLPPDGREFLKPSEVAARLRVSVGTVCRLCRLGLLKSIRLGRTIRIHAAALESLLAGGVNQEGKPHGR